MAAASVTSSTTAAAPAASAPATSTTLVQLVEEFIEKAKTQAENDVASALESQLKPDLIALYDALQQHVNVKSALTKLHQAAVAMANALHL